MPKSSKHDQTNKHEKSKKKHHKSHKKHNDEPEMKETDLTNVEINEETGEDMMVFEVEIIDKKREIESQVKKAAEHGICALKRWQFLLIGNLLILLLTGLTIAIAIVLNIPKDGSGTTSPKSINETCLTDSTECSSVSGLYCPDGICVCFSDKTWNGTDCVCKNNTYFDGFNCVNNKNYSETCSSSMPCLTTYVCNGTVCTCPTPSTQYYNTSSGDCVSKLGYNVACSSYIQCQDTIGLTCMNSVCDCMSTYYYGSGQCNAKKSAGQPCTTITECLTGLNCTASLCSCGSGYYWNGTACTPTKTYNNPCASSSECISTLNLTCQTTANACNCPLTSNVGMCDCPSNTFWDTVSCVPRKSINGSCAGSYGCVSGVNLFCSYGWCVCTGGLQWNTTLSSCV